MIYHLTRDEVDALPVGAVVMRRGKELAHTAAVGEARRLLRSPEVLALPVLDGARYAGAVDRDAIPADAPDDAPLAPFVHRHLPVASADLPAAEALRLLDATGGQRLVVVNDDGVRYHGIVCLRSDRRRLCIDAARLDPHLDPIANQALKEHA